ncbi:class I adenylate-forming enzyme family protein [Streptomyces sp. LHD-70]|uniref:class I adenylate-forming enzyme family protein n=1 Tax=Streptomyces sp. LHD-70 TaxID=3072140 RepID=UPI00280E7883|nr:class I adenylate-forming enzyme family protein [Streptomyces sp. LHD-70]MDQ8706905.1 class I adenylate-forming enzyme family protein [Streptomyces sp. LHD-70]
MGERSWWGAELLAHGGHDETWASGHGDISFADLRRQSAWQAEVLHGHGIRAGDTVALHGSPSFTQLWVVFGLWSLGAQVILLDPQLDAREQAALLERAAPRFQVTLRGPSEARGVFVDECEVLVRRLPGGRRARTGHCVVQFSSGTTGRPKAVGRYSESLLAELDRLRGLDGMPRPGERVAVLEPVSHSFGLIGGVLHALDTAATLVFPAAQSPRAVAAAAAGADVLIGNPWHFDWLATAEPGLSLPRLRVAVSGGDTLSPATARTFRDRYGVAIGQAYGTTETGILATDLTGRYGTPSVGVPVPGVRTRVVGGVLEVHVPQSPYLYEDEPWSGGWMGTRDLASVDPATGVLRLHGRLHGSARPALAGGFVDLLEIETVLRAHEHVTDAVVLGLDPIEAHVAGPLDRLDLRELRSWCRRFLGDAGSPDRYHLVPELPRTASGKTVRDRGRLLLPAAGPAAPVDGGAES